MRESHSPQFSEAPEHNLEHSSLSTDRAHKATTPVHQGIVLEVEISYRKTEENWTDTKSNTSYM